MLEDAAFLDLEIQEHAADAVPGLVVFQQPEIGLYQRLVESARNRLAELELEYGIEKSKVDSIRSKLFGALRESYQERDRLRLLIQFRVCSPWTRIETPNTVSLIIKTEKFRGIKPQMNADKEG